MFKICICGGGSLGHVCSAVLSSQKDVSVNVFTRHPEQWSPAITAIDNDGKIYEGHLDTVTDNPESAISGCDIVFLCMPGFAIKESLMAIRPFLKESTIVGSIVSSTGFFFTAHDILSPDQKLFGFQRTPFIARTLEYGKRAALLGYKKQVAIAVENIIEKEDFRQIVERLWITPVRLLNSIYEAALTNSNPILHTGRLFAMWKDWDGKPYKEPLLFYKEWDIRSSETIIAMDEEFQNLLKVLPVSNRAIPTLLNYYESNDSSSLCDKIKSIPAFQTILAPMKETPDGWIPDFGSRYFTEDFPFGLAYIVNLAKEYNIPMPLSNEVFLWGMEKIY